MMCSKGPPWVPGKTPESNNELIIRVLPLVVFRPKGFSKSFLIMMIPPLGPLSVLWVVLVTI